MAANEQIKIDEDTKPLKQRKERTGPSLILGDFVTTTHDDDKNKSSTVFAEVRIRASQQLVAEIRGVDGDTHYPAKQQFTRRKNLVIVEPFATSGDLQDFQFRIGMRAQPDIQAPGPLPPAASAKDHWQFTVDVKLTFDDQTTVVHSLGNAEITSKGGIEWTEWYPY